VAGSVLLTLAPGLITGPALYCAGFGAEGVAAGSCPPLLYYYIIIRRLPGLRRLFTKPTGCALTNASYLSAGSAAAAAQGGIGNVVLGSVFATLQSAGAGGVGAGVVNGVVQGAGVGFAAAASGGRFLWAKL
jgi:hypothetical protein